MEKPIGILTREPRWCWMAYTNITALLRGDQLQTLRKKYKEKATHHFLITSPVIPQAFWMNMIRFGEKQTKIVMNI